MDKKNILITGGLGFIGNNLTKKALNEGHDVTILSRSKKRIGNISGLENKVNLIFKDIAEVDEEVKDKDYIFHLASTVDNYNINTNPYLDIEINSRGSIALLEAVKKHNINSEVVLASSFFVNGPLKDLPATPQSPCNPTGLYSATKLSAEHFFKIYNKTFDMNTKIARFTNVFGPNEDRHNKKKAAFNYLIGLAIDDKEIPVYQGGEFFRDYIYVDNVSDALLSIAEKGDKDEIYYVGGGKIKFKDLIETVVDVAGTGKIINVQPPEFHSRVGISDFYCDTSPLESLGWKPKISVKEGIRRTIDSYRV